jgi:trigger factor
MEKGDTKTIEIAYPEDYEDKDLAGTTSTVVVTVNDIKSREVPEMTDELVKQISEGSEEKIETVGELKEKIKTAMEKAASDVADRQVEQNIVEKVIEGAEINFPEAMVREEVQHRFQDLLSELKSRKMTIEEYLEATGRTFEQLTSQLESASERDIKVNLVLYEVAKAENIEVTDEDVEAEIEKMAQESGMPVESIKAYMDKTGGRSSIESRLLR